MRLIDADVIGKFLDDFADSCGNHQKAVLREVKYALGQLPTIEAVPTEFHDKCQQLEIQKRLKLEEELKERHGHWEDIDGDGSIWRCSVCGEVQCCNSNYCGDCGAKMDEVTE